MRRTYRNNIYAFMSALLLTAAVAGVSYAMSAPAGEVPRELYCAECGMTVNPEGPFASNMTFTGGKTVWFCDLGDMMLHYDRVKDKGRVGAVKVKDYVSNSWTDGRKAFYLTGSKVRTPMRYGIIAFSGRKTAEEFRAKSGGDKVVTFDEAISSGVFRE